MAVRPSRRRNPASSQPGVGAFIGTFIGLGAVAIVINLALLAGAIAVVVLVLRALGVIG